MALIFGYSMSLRVCSYGWSTVDDEEGAVRRTQDQVRVGPRVPAAYDMCEVRKDAGWLPRSRPLELVQAGGDVSAQHRLQLQSLTQFHECVLYDTQKL